MAHAAAGSSLKNSETSTPLKPDLSLYHRKKIPGQTNMKQSCSLLEDIFNVDFKP